MYMYYSYMRNLRDRTSLINSLCRNNNLYIRFSYNIQFAFQQYFKITMGDYKYYFNHVL